MLSLYPFLVARRNIVSILQVRVMHSLGLSSRFRGFPKVHYQKEITYTPRNLFCARFLSTSAILRDDGLIKRLKQKMSGLISNKTKVGFASILVYEKCADELNWNHFFNTFELPDTFQSWFLAIQLHVWMCAVVAVPEQNGRVFRNKLVGAMWSDVEFRLNELKEIPKSDRKKYLSSMVEQFNATLISYDEGILSNDTVLAAAVWRTLYGVRYVDPRLLESVVFYIRKQVSHLDSLNMEEMILKGSITFLPIQTIVHQLRDEKFI